MFKASHLLLFLAMFFASCSTKQKAGNECQLVNVNEEGSSFKYDFQDVELLKVRDGAISCNFLESMPKLQFVSLINVKLVSLSTEFRFPANLSGVSLDRVQAGPDVASVIMNVPMNLSIAHSRLPTLQFGGDSANACNLLSVANTELDLENLLSRYRSLNRLILTEQLAYLQRSNVTSIRRLDIDCTPFPAEALPVFLTRLEGVECIYAHNVTAAQIVALGKSYLQPESKIDFRVIVENNGPIKDAVAKLERELGRAIAIIDVAVDDSEDFLTR